MHNLVSHAKLQHATINLHSATWSHKQTYKYGF